MDSFVRARSGICASTANPTSVASTIALDTVAAMCAAPRTVDANRTDSKANERHAGVRVDGPHQHHLECPPRLGEKCSVGVVLRQLSTTQHGLWSVVHNHTHIVLLSHPQRVQIELRPLARKGLDNSDVGTAGRSIVASDSQPIGQHAIILRVEIPLTWNDVAHLRAQSMPTEK